MSLALKKSTAALALSLTLVAGPALAPAGQALLPSASAADVATPEVKVEDGYFTSNDGKNTKIYWKTNKVANAKGTVVVLHGAAEHQGRYDYVTQKLNEAGYNVYRMDHRGHGRSALPELDNRIPRGHIDDFHFMADDVNILVQKAKGENPGQKTFMLGHSMGALLSEFYGIKYSGQVDGIVTTGGGAAFNLSGQSQAGYAEHVTPDQITEAQKQLAPTVYELLPWHELTSFNDPLAAQAYKGNKDLRLPSLAVTGLMQTPNIFTGATSIDPAVAEQYKTDPLVNKTVSVGMAQQLAVAAVYDSVNAASFTTPTLAIHGTKDTLVPPFFDENWYSAIGSKDKELIYMHGQMHEIMNEPTKDQSISKIISWIDERNV